MVVHLIHPGKAPPWREDDVPLERRGISATWLFELVAGVQERFNEPRARAIVEAERAEGHNKAGLYGRHDMPDMRVPTIPNVVYLNAHGFVTRSVKPVTEETKVPLYALVPEEFRGPPDTFVSHAWNALLVGPSRQRIGTLDALKALGDKYVWIDFICYNQHVFDDISRDMLRIMEAIGHVSVCATPMPIYNRAWCLWELYCAQQAGTGLDLRVCPGFRNDKILSVNGLYRSFKGLENARSSSARDQQTIHDAFIQKYGGVEQANAALNALIEEKFSGAWHELQPRDGPLEFSPTPFVADQKTIARGFHEPYWLPGFLDSDVYGSDKSVGELFVYGGVYAGSLAEMQVALDRMGPQEAEFARAIANKDLGAVRALLRAGLPPGHADRGPRANRRGGPSRRA